jgi:NodT family efflux transporter outer membrane factor (OMF) lipoprotein
MPLTNKLRVTCPLVISVALLLTGCVVGPNFNKPAAPNVSGYISTPLSTTSSVPNVAGGDAQQFVPGQDIAGDWWTLFHSQPLSDLVEQSLKANPNIQSAQAALLVARENISAQRGFYYPNVSAGFSATRAQTSQELSPVPNATQFSYSLFTPQLSVSYTPDVFGLNRRTVESLVAQKEQARFALAATNITLSSNVVAAAIQEAALRAQIDATNQLIKINTDMLTILRNQFAAGYVARLDVAAQEANLAQVVATLPPLMKQLAQQRDLLAALSGAFPDHDLPATFQLSTLQLPTELPVTIQSQLVQQRPDVLQAQENLHAASAQIGIARANRFPSFPLTADAGRMALTFADIFTAPTGFWDLSASITQPVFDGGTLKHRERAAQDAYTEAEAQYRSTVLTAFQNVADALHALQQDADALKAASDAKDASGVTLDQLMRQFQLGYTNYLALLSAEQIYQQAVVNVAIAQGNRYADTAALFQALGGGWWNRTDVPKN